MMIEIDPSMLDGLVRAWLKDTLQIIESNLASDYLHPEDEKTYKKDIKAVRQLLDYVGEAL